MNLKKRKLYFASYNRSVINHGEKKKNESWPIVYLCWVADKKSGQLYFTVLITSNRLSFYMVYQMYKITLN